MQLKPATHIFAVQTLVFDNYGISAVLPIHTRETSAIEVESAAAVLDTEESKGARA
jgi:hypothetical protein